MDKSLIANIAVIRVCVGYLGENDHFSWWPSSFFSKSSEAFLKPVFNKTHFLTQYYGVKAAATIVHDEHIGIGKDVFHLFRLPEQYEIEIHGLLGKADSLSFLPKAICDKNSAQNFLMEFSNMKTVKDFGPVRLGEMKDIHKGTTWKAVAHHYLEGFKSGNEVFPYFSTSK